MKKLIALVFAFAFIFGCIGGEEQPPPPPVENVTENETPDITVIIEEQENITVAVNETEVGENVTEEVWGGIEYSEEPDAITGIYFLDVCTYGTGDHGGAVFIKKGDLDILIDAGSWNTASRVIDYLRLRGIDDLDLVVSTTGDYRRYGGLDAVLDDFEVEEFWWGGDTFGDADYAEIISKATEKAGNVRIVERGYMAELNGIEIEVLNPKKTDRFNNVNNDAIVLRIDDRDLSLLLMSNIQTGGQGDLIGRYDDKLDVDVIESPYYGVGAGTAQIALFLQESKPEFAVIGGCSDETLEVEGSTRNPYKRLLEQEQYSVDYFEVYKGGTVRISVDEGGYGVMYEE